MESSGVLSQVDVPTEWCAAMLASATKDGQFQDLLRSQAAELVCSERSTIAS